MTVNFTQFTEDMMEDDIGYGNNLSEALSMNMSNGPPQFYIQTKYACDILMPIVCSIGIIGNILSLIVLTRKEMTSPTNCFLTALGVSDLCLLLVQIPVFLELNQTLMKSHNFVIFIRYYYIARYVFTNLHITCTCWITTAVTIERFLSLCFLMNAKMTCTIWRARAAILAIVLASCVFHFSKFFEYVPNTDTSTPRPLIATALVQNKAYETYLHVVQITLAVIIPVFLLIIFNSFLVYFLAMHRRRMAKRAYKTGSMSSVDMMHISIVVVTMVLIFILCHSIGVYIGLNIAVRGRLAIFGDHLFHSLKHINNLLVMFNSSINFLLYCAISKKFRTTFSGIFLDKILGKKTSWSYKTSMTEQSLSTKMPVMSFISHSNSSSSNKSGDNSEV